MLTALWISIAAAQDTWPADSTIDDALRLQMTPQGLSAAADIATEVVPLDPFDIPALTQNDPLGGFPGCLADYYYSFTNGWVTVEVLTASIVPSNGVLTLTAEIEVVVNTSFDPLIMDLGAACVSGDCDAYVDPFIVDISAPVTLAVVGGDIRATIGTVNISDDLVGSDVNITNCTAGSLISGVNSALNLIGQPDLYQIAIDEFARPYAYDQVPAIVADIQAAIDDALQISEFSTSIDLLGTTIEVEVAAESIAVTPQGVDVQVSSRVYANQNPCMAGLDPGGSRRLAGAAPGVTTLPANTHVGARISSDMIDQGLYAIWRGGLLCQNLEGGEIGGFTLDTGLLTLVGGESYGELFPEVKPLTVRTVPTNPPLTVASATHDLAVSVQDLGIDFYAELDGRQARALGISVSPEVGLDATFSNTFGTIVVDLALPDTYNATLRGDPMVPDAEQVVADVEGIIGTLAGTALSGALGDSLSFELPTFEGYGLRNLAITGTAGGWTTAEAAVGTVTYNGAQGCDQGCQGSAGCSTPGGAIPWGGGLLALLLLRRRR